MLRQPPRLVNNFKHFAQNDNNMKHRYLVLPLLMLLLAATVSAQQRYRRAAQRRDTVPVLVRMYADSLALCRQRLDSLQAQASGQVGDSAHAVGSAPENRYYRLFVPLTFYHDISRDRFSLDTDTAATDGVADALLSVYLHRPDLVHSTQSEVDAAGPILSSPREVAPSVDQVVAVRPKADDADFDMTDIILHRPNFWTFNGQFAIDLAQNYYSGNWPGRGENNYTTREYLKLYAKYDNKKRLFVENMIEATLGFNSSKTDTLHSVRTNASDLHYKGNLSVRAVKSWSYSLQVDARTQLLRIFDNNSNHVKTDFGSPLYVNVSVGMRSNFKFFKGKLAGDLNIGTFAYNYRYCDRADLVGNYGIQAGKHSLQDYGSRVDLNFNIGFVKNLTWRVESYFYTTYSRAEAQILNKFDFRFNKYLATHLEFYARYDDSRQRDDHHGYWMFRDYLSFGLSVNL